MGGVTVTYRNVSILDRVVGDHGRLVREGRKPNSLFLSSRSRAALAQQATDAYGITYEYAYNGLLGMKIYTSEEYLGDRFRIYCEPQGA